jgi:hypothetical protein
MAAERINRWLTLGAKVGVIVGLVLVAYEIDQSGTSLELAASSDGVDNFTQAMETLVQNEELSRLIYRAETAYGELDDFERWRVFKYLDGFISMSQQDYLVYLAMDDETEELAFLDDWQENMTLPMYRDYWSESYTRFNPRFRQFIDSIVRDIDGSE